MALKQRPEASQPRLPRGMELETNTRPVFLLQAFKHLSLGWNLNHCAKFYGCRFDSAAWECGEAQIAAPAVPRPTVEAVLNQLIRSPIHSFTGSAAHERGALRGRFSRKLRQGGAHTHKHAHLKCRGAPVSQDVEICGTALARLYPSHKR